MRFFDEDQMFRSVAVIGIYETAASVALKEKDPRAPRTMFVIASVSLSNYGNEAKQVEQAGVLISAIDRARTKCSKPEQGGSRYINVNIIIAGNFNCVPGSAAYNLLTANAPTALQSEVTPPHTLPLASAFASFQGGREPPFTTVSRSWEGTTSYIFYSHPEVGVTSLLEFPSKELIGSTGLPNNDFSSNHLLMEASLVF